MSTKVSTAKLRKAAKRFTQGDSSALIPALQALQDEAGWLPPRALETVAQHLNVPLSRVYGVATFYAQFYLEPRGRHLIRCCRGTACHVRGASEVIAAVEDTLGVKDGGTTPDMAFSLETVACLGACALAPVVVLDGKYHGKMTAEKVRRLLHEHAKTAEADDDS